jgi:uridylate kinase
MLKYSGEALGGDNGNGIDPKVVHHIATEIKKVVNLGVEVGVIIGGGNFIRGAKLYHDLNVNRVTGDQMGMISTIINALAVKDIFTHAGIPTRTMSALPIDGLIDRFDRQKALDLLQQKYTLIFAGGTGNPLVTTDTALSLRGIELNADLLLKATNVDGIYSEDPTKNPKAKLYSHLTYSQVLAKELAVMDLGSFFLCRDNKMRLRVFNMHKNNALYRIVMGEDEGTVVE